MRVYDETDTLLGTGTCGRDGSVAVGLSQALSTENSVYATQEVETIVSGHHNPTTIQTYTGGFIQKPRIPNELYQCAKISLITGTIPGATLEVTHTTEADFPSSKAIARDRVHLKTLNGSQVTSTLGETLDVRQVMCPANPIATSGWTSTDVVSAPTTIPAPEPTRDDGMGGKTFGVIGDTSVAATSLVPGAETTFYRAPGSTSWFDVANIARSTIFTELPIIQSSWSIRANQQLCGVTSADSPATPPADPTTAGVLNAPNILEPVCRNAPWVEVNTSDPNHYTVLYNSNGVLSYTSSTGIALIGIPPSDPLVKNQVINAASRMTTGPYGPLDSATVVEVGGQLDVRGGAPFLDQNTNAIISNAFIRQQSQGPEFVFKQCCDAGLNTNNVTFEIRDSSHALIDTVDAIEVLPGYHKARWNFYGLSDNPSESLPEPSETFTVTATGSCNTTTYSNTFTVIAGEIQAGDATAPSLELTASAPSTSETVLAGATSTVQFEPGETITFNMKGVDPYGVKESKMVLTNDVTGTFVTTALKQAPLPSELDVTHTHSALPGQTITIVGSTKDFSNNTSSNGILTVTVDNASPVISDIENSSTFTNNGEGSFEAFTIYGEQLSFSNTVTSVEFRDPGTGTVLSTVLTFDGESEEKLVFSLPPDLSGIGGLVDVVVLVGSSESPPFSIELLDREGPFTNYGSGFSCNFLGTIPVVTQCNANSSDPNAIDRVATVAGVTNDECVVRVYLNSNNSPNTNQGNTTGADNTFNLHQTSATTNGAGFILHTESCRTILTNSGENTLNRYHYKEGENTSTYGQEQNVKTIFHLALSQDGTIMTQVSLLDSANSYIFIYDLTKDSSQKISAELVGCTSSSSCQSNSLLEYGRVIKIFVDSVLETTKVL